MRRPSYMWELIIWVLPALLMIGAAAVVGFWGVGVGSALAWAGYCIFQGTIIVKQREFAVIERLGKLHHVCFRGWHVRVLIVDRVKEVKGSMTAKRLSLYANEAGTALTERATLDFVDGSAPIRAAVFYQVGKSEDIDLFDRGPENNPDWAAARDKLVEAIVAFSYKYDDPEMRIDNLIDAELRPELQQLTIDEVSTDKKKEGESEGQVDKIVIAVIESVKGDLAEFGVYAPSGKRLLVIEDVDLPKEILALRQQRLEGTKLSEQREAEALGFYGPIKKISTELGISIAEARAIYETQRGLDTIREVKPAMTLIGKDLANVLGTTNLGSK